MTTATQTATSPIGGSRRRSLRGWLGARLLRGLAGVLMHLPDAALHRAAAAVGVALYRTQPRRRSLVRNNLRRVVTYLQQNDLGGERVAAAARDGRALEAMTRAAFAHYVRGYLEGAILPSYARDDRLARVIPDDPELVNRAFNVRADGGSDAGAMIILGLHFGALEIPALWATRRLGTRITAPMETIANADLQAYFQRSRAGTGLRIIPTRGAAAVLKAGLARGEAVALVADRSVVGMGTPVSLFGFPARLPVGPAVLALETGAPAWLIATRRTGWRDYRARIEAVALPAEGPRRERISGFLAAQASAFEHAIADAPEQWWTMFFPIWDDIRG